MIYTCIVGVHYCLYTTRGIHTTIAGSWPWEGPWECLAWLGLAGLGWAGLGKSTAQGRTNPDAIIQPRVGLACRSAEKATAAHPEEGGAMAGHHHQPGMPQNLGNTLGARPCVRQSKLYRQHESGNAAKSLLGMGNLAWSIDHKEGAYKGQRAYDHHSQNGGFNVRPAPSEPRPPAAEAGKRGIQDQPQRSPVGYNRGREYTPQERERQHQQQGQQQHQQRDQPQNTRQHVPQLPPQDYMPQQRGRYGSQSSFRSTRPW